MHRTSGQGDLGQAWLSPKLGRNARLDRIGSAFDWTAVERLVSGVYSARSGRPSWPPLMMVKALLLQQWYGLSDPGLEEALGDRLSFRRFVGLGLDEGAPDHSVISRFRKASGTRMGFISTTITRRIRAAAGANSCHQVAPRVLGRISEKTRITNVSTAENAATHC